MLDGRFGIYLLEKENKMQEYEYVTRAEYGPKLKELESILKKAQKIMEEKYDTPFCYELIGSGRRHLITRIKGGNKGYDFDFNLIIPHPGDGYSYKAKVVDDQFRDALNIASRGTSYSFPEDSTSVFTLKNKDTKNSKINYGGDLAIVYYDEEANNGYYYLKRLKNGTYVFELRKQSRNIEYKLDEILEYTNGWNWIREEYLLLKNRNKDINKKSFVLYLEAVHNVYNQIQQMNEE